MNPQEQTDAFARDLDALVRKYQLEFDLTTATAVGVLTIKATQLTLETIAQNDEPEDEDDANPTI